MEMVKRKEIKLMIKECCDWRIKLEQAIEMNDESLVREIIWC
jgi:hypothetical protein